jgi:hypothetical protein
MSGHPGTDAVTDNHHCYRVTAGYRNHIAANLPESFGTLMDVYFDV